MCPKQVKNLDTKKVKTIISVKPAVLVWGSAGTWGGVLILGGQCWYGRGQCWYRGGGCTRPADFWRVHRRVGGKSHSARRNEERVKEGKLVQSL